MFSEKMNLDGLEVNVLFEVERAYGSIFENGIEIIPAEPATAIIHAVNVTKMDESLVCRNIIERLADSAFKRVQDHCNSIAEEMCA